jgi:hypothetical protein
MAWQFPLPPQGLSASTESLLARWDEAAGSSRGHTGVDAGVNRRAHAATDLNASLARSASEGNGRPGEMDSEMPSLARRAGATHSSAQAALEERLVRCIRQWQPEVIVTEDVSPRGEDPLGHLTNQLVLAAAMKASELTAYPDQIALAGLEAWKVKKVVAVVGNGRQGVINVTPAQWMPRLGRTLAEQAALGKSLLSCDVEPAPMNIGMAVLIDHLPQESGRRDAMSGIVMTPGSAGRRELASPPPGDLEQLSRLAQKRHNVEQLLTRIGGGKGQAMGQMMQVGALIDGMPERHQGEILWQVGQRLYRAGQGEQAAEALGLLIEKHPHHPLADAAARWLVAYYASSEVLCRQRKNAKYAVQVAKFTEEQSAAVLAGTAAGPAPAVATPAAATIAEASAVPPVAAGQRSGRAIAIARLIEQTRPTLYADPAVRFPLGAAQRHAGQSRAAEQWFDFFARQRNDDWGRSAAAEGWLTHPQAEPPKKLVSVVTALSKPKLDGRLDDPLWQVARPCSLTSQSVAFASGFQPSVGESAGPSLPTTVVLAFDEEFLYVAASCRKAPGQDYASDDSPRTPDAALASRDRLTLWLDVDRDYATGWELTVDHRGWPAEACWGDATWNPEWFIAAAGDENWWTIEVAIPLAELAVKKPAVRDVWAVGLTRVVPAHGVQSLAPPATLVPQPESWGLLTFE